MPAPIQFDTWESLALWIIFIGSLAYAITGISKFIDSIKNRSETAKLKAELQKHAEYLNNDQRRINELELKIDNIKHEQDDLKNISRLTLGAVQELLQSNLEGGNNKAGMKSASDKIQNYFRDHI